MTLEERLWSQVQKGAADDCWPWIGGLSENGYGRTKVHGRQRAVHRLLYELLVEQVPKGVHLDHTCHNADSNCSGGTSCSHRACVNPAHLEPVTPQENTRRSPHTLASIHAAKTHCVQGHPFDEANTIHESSGRRRCLTCRRKSNRESMRRRTRAAKGATS